MARADGGTVRLSEQRGNYRITAFTSPTPFRAGPVDISVFVQDAESGETVNDVRIVVHLTPIDQPDDALAESATTDAATNKLFRSALFDLPTPGRWRANIAIEGPTGRAHARFEIEAGEPMPRWLAIWPWIGWPAIAIALFGVHQYLVCRKAGQSRSAIAVTPRPL
jgi:hypothetical protein